MPDIKSIKRRESNQRLRYNRGKSKEFEINEEFSLKDDVHNCKVQSN